MSLKHVPATCSQVCQLCYMSLLHVPATCPVSVYLTRFCPRHILQQHVPATCPLVWAHLKTNRDRKLESHRKSASAENNFF